MSRRSLIFCFSALAAMVVMIVAAVAFLYRKDEKRAPIESRYALSYAVPSNAVMVCFLSQASALSAPVFSSFEFPEALAGFLSSGNAGSIAGNPMALSLHYSGSLSPLYVFDAGPASDSISKDAAALMEFGRQNGFHAEYLNCAQYGSSCPLSDRSLVLVSKTKAHISMSQSHLKEGESLMDAEGFAVAAQDAPEDVIFLSYERAKVLFSSASSFFRSFGDWASIAVSGGSSFSVLQNYSQGSDFMSVLDHASPSVSTLSDMLPSYTAYALTLPMQDAGSYISDYSTYLESQRKLKEQKAWQDVLKKRAGISPQKLMERLQISEVASAAFMCGDRMENVNLVKIANADTVLLRGTGDRSLAGAPKVRSYAFADYLASVFGKYFKLADESCFTYMNGWLITGSRRAVDEYASGMALEYPLKTYMADAGKGDLFAERVSSCVFYLNLPKGNRYLSGVLNRELAALHDDLKGDAGYAPVVMSVFDKGGRMHTDITVYHLELNRLRAPKYERDTEVTVPKGPFKVINSGTGRRNLFYQQDNGAICLQEEDGRGIWGIPFKQKLCGTAHNIDYYANGNKQILFGAGSNLYLIDRLGRFVNGFPVDLGKEILIGPDVYDFNGVNAYNVLVLHKDNTVEMYNLKGRKPDSWLGIAPDETIKSLPERVVVGGKTFWAVRTSRQTLIYSFYGGKPLNSFKGDSMFLPDSEIRVKNSTTIEAECYDGQIRSVKVK
jgi:hypothetical protein